MQTPTCATSLQTRNGCICRVSAYMTPFQTGSQQICRMFAHTTPFDAGSGHVYRLSAYVALLNLKVVAYAGCLYAQHLLKMKVFIYVDTLHM